MKIINKSLELNGKQLSLEIGRFAEQAGSAVLARYGDTMVLATVTASLNEVNLGYFPLGVEYLERLYAGGRIKGSRWVKREGRPSDDAVLSARLIDRAIRPLFPKTFNNEVQVIVTVLSVDGENDPDVLGLVATSAAIALSPVPWSGPIGAVRMGYVKGRNGESDTFMVNPTAGEQAFSEFDLIVASTKDKIFMLEGGFCEVDEKIVYEAIERAKEYNAKIIALIDQMVKEAGKTKMTTCKDTHMDELKKKISKKYSKELKELFSKKAEQDLRDGGVGSFAVVVMEESDEKCSIKEIEEAVGDLFKDYIRRQIVEKGIRSDGRKQDEIRPIEIEVGILPRTHGSAMFRRGKTQVLTVATLGTPSLEQLIESPTGEESKRYIHHYSMPPYSVGETGRIGYPSRREIGHGALAERAMISVIPLEETFPYTIRLVSEIMSSNGSTSMASTCGSTLALMDAGVPIKEPVAGISIGLVIDKNRHILLSDISGIEDFCGDMDFKVAGTKNGVTAIQLDVKIDGLLNNVIQETLEKARIARERILEKMISVIHEPRRDLSKYAPKVQVVKIPVEKIGDVIGPGGRIIRQIIAVTGADVDVEDDGSIMISGTSSEAVKKAVDWVKGLTQDVERGEVYEGEVKRILPFGAFIEILPGKEGMVHVSQMSHEYVRNPEDVVSIGQKVKVQVIEIDEQHRINLSMLFGKEAKPGLDKTERQHRFPSVRHPRNLSSRRRY